MSFLFSRRLFKRGGVHRLWTVCISNLNFDNLNEAAMVKRIALFFLLSIPTSAVADGYGFMTPSGNIFCNGAVESSEISCTIVERTGAPALQRPASCTTTWGHTFHLNAIGPASLSCTNVPRRVNYTDVAPYGVTGEFGDVTCQSENTGLTCRNRDGRGFFLSRRKQEIF